MGPVTRQKRHASTEDDEPIKRARSVDEISLVLRIRSAYSYDPVSATPTPIKRTTGL